MTFVSRKICLVNIAFLWFIRGGILSTFKLCYIKLNTSFCLTLFVMCCKCYSALITNGNISKNNRKLYINLHLCLNSVHSVNTSTQFSHFHYKKLEKSQRWVEIRGLQQWDLKALFLYFNRLCQRAARSSPKIN